MFSRFSKSENKQKSKTEQNIKLQHINLALAELRENQKSQRPQAHPSGIAQKHARASHFAQKLAHSGIARKIGRAALLATHEIAPFFFYHRLRQVKVY